MLSSQFYNAILAFLGTYPTSRGAEIVHQGTKVSPEGSCITPVLYEGAPAGYMTNVSNSKSSHKPVLLLN
jgi:hypothetical protein